MRNLPTWQKPIAWLIVYAVLPFYAVRAMRASAKRRIWAGKIFLHDVRESAALKAARTDAAMGE